MPDEITVVVESGLPDILMFYQDEKVTTKDFPEGYGERFCKQYFPLVKIGILTVR